MWDLPGPGIEHISPTLAGRFFTTEPPGKPFFFKWGPLFSFLILARSSFFKLINLTTALGIFSRSIWTLTCGIWALVPWTGIEPRPPCIGSAVLAPGPPVSALEGRCESIRITFCLPAGEKADLRCWRSRFWLRENRPQHWHWPVQWAQGKSSFYSLRGKFSFFSQTCRWLCVVVLFPSPAFSLNQQ